MVDPIGGLEPDDYDDLGFLKSNRALTVYDKHQDEGIIEVKHSWDQMQTVLKINNKYTDFAHLGALNELESRYEDHDLPGDLTIEEVRNVSAASSSDEVNVEWVEDIEVGIPGSDVHY